jgi:hypothetical protein
VSGAISASSTSRGPHCTSTGPSRAQRRAPYPGDELGDAIAGLTSALIDGYKAATSELATTGRTLPGAKETLALLAKEPVIHQTGPKPQG